MEGESKASCDEKPVTPPSSTASGALTPPRSPHKIHHTHHMHHILVPGHMPTRTRTSSQSELAAESPLQHGICKIFCRNKGHGFITPDDGGEDIFVHISDIEGEYVLKEGDRVNYRTILHPPKLLKKQAVEVVITQYTQGPREKWAETKVNSQHKRF